MNTSKKYHLIFWVWYISPVLMWTGTPGSPVLNAPIELLPLVGLLLLLGSFILSFLFAVKFLRHRGYKKYWYLLSILGPYSYPFILFLPPKNKTKQKYRRRELWLASLVILVGLSSHFLESFGYKIYGTTTYVYGVPTPEEGWMKVDKIGKNYLSTVDGEKAFLREYSFTDLALKSDPDEVCEVIYGMPFDDLYIRKNATTDEWEVRFRNYTILDGHSYFLPSRVYGYYNSELDVSNNFMFPCKIDFSDYVSFKDETTQQDGEADPIIHGNFENEHQQ